jgi:oligoribonuclease NrnB/cAMP/cGMP phosphodiesterase (DHH superfamily)
MMATGGVGAQDRVPLIIHHAGCSDGICGALVIWLGLGRRGELLPAQYGDDPPAEDVVRDREVWIVDFSYPRDTLVHLHELAAALVVLDHHKTAAANCEGLDFCEFDMERSGARMALDRVYAQLKAEGVPLPGPALDLLVDYVQDRDLWRWELPWSREVNAWLASWPRTLESWRKVLSMFTYHGVVDELVVKEGAAILRREQQLVEIICGRAKSSRWTAVQGTRSISGSCLIVNASVLQSEVGDELASVDGVDFAAVWYQRADGRRQYSLRSRGDFDVSALAQMYGGGGHRRAAGFVSDEQLGWLLIPVPRAQGGGPE